MTGAAVAVPGDTERTELLAVATAAVGRHFPLAAAKARGDGDPLDRAAWAALCRELEPVGLAVPEAAGGSGLGFGYLAVVAEAAGAAVAPAPLTMTAGLVAPLLAEAAPELLPGILAGSTVACHIGGAAVEPAAGRLVASGGVAAVPWGADADYALLTSRHGDTVRVCVLTPDTPGVRVARCRTVDRSRPAARWRFADAPVRPCGTLPAAVLRLIETRARLLTACEAIGSARTALDRALRHVAVRAQFGRPVGSFQAVQHRAADLYGELESAAAAVEWATGLAAGFDGPRGAERFDHPDGRAFERACLVALVRATDAAERVARESLHLHGGIGFTWEHDAHLFLKRALADGQCHGGRAALLLELAASLPDA